MIVKNYHIDVKDAAIHQHHSIIQLQLTFNA